MMFLSRIANVSCFIEGMCSDSPVNDLTLANITSSVMCRLVSEVICITWVSLCIENFRSVVLSFLNSL